MGVEDLVDDHPGVTRAALEVSRCGPCPGEPAARAAWVGHAHLRPAWPGERTSGLRQETAAGPEESSGAIEERRHVAADPDVAIEEQRRPPPAGIGYRTEDRRLDCAGAPASRCGHRSRGRVDAQGRETALAGGSHMAARTAADIE